MIEVSRLSKSYGNSKAVDDISFQIPEGSVVGFLGANGAGKTTTMDMLTGCQGQDSGEIKIMGSKLDGNDWSILQQVGYLPDEPPLHGEMTVREFLRYVGNIRGLSGAKLKSAYQTQVNQLSMQQVESKLIRNLSKGYRQRVALAQAIIHEPKVWILDEPTEGLDPTQIKEIRNLIESRPAGTTVMLSSHIMSEVEKNCESLLILDEGSIVASGTVAEIKNRFQKKYLIRCEPINDTNQNLFQTIRGADQSVNATEISANSVEISIKNSEEELDRILAACVKEKIRIREVRESGSLEELFSQLTTEKKAI